MQAKDEANHRQMNSEHVIQSYRYFNIPKTTRRACKANINRAFYMIPVFDLSARSIN